MHASTCIRGERKQCIRGERKQIELNTNVELNATEKDAGDHQSISEDAPNKNDKPKQKTFFQLWLRTIWKMRSVYGGLAVHCFDVLTDILVIMQWLELDDVEDANINPQ
eukprot:162804_1